MKYKIVTKPDGTSTYDITANHLEISCNYKESGYLDVSPLTSIKSGNVTGEGKATITIHNLNLNTTGLLDLTTRLMQAGLPFEDFDIKIEGLKINNVAVDWAQWKKDFANNYEADFRDNGPEFIERVKAAIGNGGTV